MVGTGRRNSHLFAIAPNANSSILCNTTPSIEPMASNAYTQKTRNGIFQVRNRYLEPVLEKYGTNTPETWKNIEKNNGSVQHLAELTTEEKEVFKTAWEIDQHWLVEHAEARQQYICQSQSLNLFFLPGSDRAYINSVHLKALRSPTLKSLYYFKTGAKVATFKNLDDDHSRETSFWNEVDDRIDSTESNLPSHILDIIVNDLRNCKKANYDLCTDDIKEINNDRFKERPNLSYSLRELADRYDITINPVTGEEIEPQKRTRKSIRGRRLRRAWAGGVTAHRLGRLRGSQKTGARKHAGAGRSVPGPGVRQRRRAAAGQDAYGRAWGGFMRRAP
jgi:hypothetical protein